LPYGHEDERGERRNGDQDPALQPEQASGSRERRGPEPRARPA
jgi:hypothetical protein